MDEAQGYAELKRLAGPLVFGALIFLSIVAWSYFHETAPQSDLGLKNVIGTILSEGLLSGSLDMLGRVFTLQFTLFTLLMPLSLGLIALLPFYYGRVKAYVVAFGASFAALVALVVMFGFSSLGMVNAAFFGLAIVVILESTRIKKEEYRKFVTFRSVANACKAGLLLISIGILVTTAVTAHRENDRNTKQLGDDLIGVAFSQNASQSSLTNKIADLVLQSQQQSLQLLSSTPQFQKLRQKSDQDVQAYVLMVDAAEKAADDPATKQRIVDEMNKKIDSGMGSGQQLITVDTLRKQSPMLEIIFRYYWVLLAFGVWTTFLMFSNLVLSNLAGIYSTIIRQFIELIKTSVGPL